MSTEIVHRQIMEKQQQQIDKNMRGCMSGFFNIFDRNHLLSGKRFYPKRLPPSIVGESPSGPASSLGSPELSQELEKPNPKPYQALTAPPTTPPTVSPWKFSREAPRLSLDSRLHPRGIKTAASATTPRRDDESESESERQRRSPSVVARLMGLDLLPSSSDYSESEKKAELRRSASESRSRDLKSSFIDPYQYTFATSKDYTKAAAAHPDSTKCGSDSAILKPRTRRGVYGFGDFFPEPKPAIYEPSKDVEALKQILEALHLKGLLRHAAPPMAPKIGRRNFVYEQQRYPYEESPIVVMKPNRNRNRNQNQNVSVSSPITRTARSPVRSPARTPSPGRGDNRIRKVKEAATVEVRRVSPVRSPRIGNRRTEQVAAAAGQSPRRRRPSPATENRRAEDESSTVSESSFSTDTEKSKIEENYKDGKNLLERCDKLLHSIAEMTSETSNGCADTDLQPSPVSVLDSSFYKEDESSPSPVMKRTIDFKDMEDEIWSSSSSAEAFMEDNVGDEQDPDFAYVSEIIRASSYLPDDSDVFLLLEKRRSIKGRLERRLVFDIIVEILDRNRQFPPWKLGSCGPSSREVWAELQRIRKKGEESEDMFEVICGVMKRDLARDSIHGWGECQLEISEAVLDIERLIFKDLIGETIRDHAMESVPRRKLVF